MPFGITYGSREAALAEAIADVLVARGAIGGGTGGGDNSDVVAAIQNLVQQGDTLPISAAALPLPTDAATNTTLVEVRDRLLLTVPYSNYLNLGASVGVIIKNTSAKLFGFSVHNKSGSTIWINFFNKAFLPTGADTTVATYPVFAGGHLLVDAAYFGVSGMSFSNGLSVTFSITTPGDYIPAASLINNVVWEIKFL